MRLQIFRVLRKSLLCLDMQEQTYPTTRSLLCGTFKCKGHGLLCLTIIILKARFLAHNQGDIHDISFISHVKSRMSFLKFSQSVVKFRVVTDVIDSVSPRNKLETYLSLFHGLRKPLNLMLNARTKM
jgi:hypothetical protein